MERKECFEIALAFDEGEKSGTTAEGTQWFIEHGELDEMEELSVYTNIADGIFKDNNPDWELIIK